MMPLGEKRKGAMGDRPINYSRQSKKETKSVKKREKERRLPKLWEVNDGTGRTIFRGVWREY